MTGAESERGSGKSGERKRSGDREAEERERGGERASQKQARAVSGKSAAHAPLTCSAWERTVLYLPGSLN